MKTRIPTGGHDRTLETGSICPDPRRLPSRTPLSVWRGFSRHAWWLHAWLIAGMTLLPFQRGVRAGWIMAGDPGDEVLGWEDPQTGLFMSLAEMNPSGDADNDGLTNEEEAAAGTDPYNPDTDYDGLPDVIELGEADSVVFANLGYHLSPTYWDSDGDGTSDSDAYYHVLGFAFPVVVYPGGQLPAFPGATYDDYDGDGLKNYEDPVYDDPANYSETNQQYWPGTTANNDDDGDNLANWWDETPSPGDPPPEEPPPEDPPPSDGDDDDDGIEDINDPVPGNYNNPSTVNGYDWPGTRATDDDDNDTVSNWWDTTPEPPSSVDTDGDGLTDDIDPVPDNGDNPSEANGRDWPGATALDDNDSDGTPNWSDADTDGDGLDDTVNGEAYDPLPDDPNNPSPCNMRYWPGASVFGDIDGDLLANFFDEDPGEEPPPPPPPDDADGDGLTDDEEAELGTNSLKTDTDADGLSDYDEVRGGFGSDPNNKWSLGEAHGWGHVYTDSQLADLTDNDYGSGSGDGIPDSIERIYGLNPGDPADALGDLDGDGITNLDQFNAGIALNAHLTKYDSDLDGLYDAFEIFYGFDPHNPADATQDADHDGVTNYEEQQLRLNPLNPDTLGTGFGDRMALARHIYYPSDEPPANDENPQNDIPDWFEAATAGTAPFLPQPLPPGGDTDGDGMPDAWEHKYGRWRNPDIGLLLRTADAGLDSDGDGVSNLNEYRIGTNPLIRDSNAQTTGDDGDGDYDGDGLSNRQENLLGTSLTNSDSDGDGISDALELQLRLNPTKADTDGDGISDSAELAAGTDPLDAQAAAAAIGLKVLTPFDPAG